MSRRNERLIDVSAEKLMRGILAQLAEEICPSTPPQPVQPLTFGGRSELPLWFLERRGKTILFVRNKQTGTLRLRIPHLSQLTEMAATLAVFDTIRSGNQGFGQLLSEHYQQQYFAEIIEANDPEFLRNNPLIAAAVRGNGVLTVEMQLQLAPFVALLSEPDTVRRANPGEMRVKYGNFERVVTTHDLLLVFDSLPHAQQARLLPELRAVASHATFSLIAFSELRTFMGNIVTPAHIAERRQEMDDCLRFFDAMFWDRKATPSEAIRRFLPPGFLPARFNLPGNGGEADVEVSTRQVAPSDPRIDPERFAFYQTLGCRGVVEPELRFMDGNYVAFLLRTASGIRIAILDCPEIKNAAYVFRVGQLGEEGTGWVRDATSAKSVVLARAHSGEVTTFMRRFYHVGNWQNQVRNFLAQH